MFESVGQPEHGERATGATGGSIGKVEHSTRRPGHLHGESHSVVEAGELGQAKIAAERGFQKGDHQNVVAATVAPVSGPFVIGAVGCVLVHRQRQGLDSRMHNLGSHFRLLVGNGQGTCCHTAVTDLVPVGNGPDEPAVALFASIGIQPGRKAMPNDRFTNCPSLLFGPIVVQPVVADRESVGHFAGIQEVTRIPVFERRGCLQFLPDAIEISTIALQAVDQGTFVDACEHAAAGAEQTFSVGNSICIGGLLQSFLSLLLHFGVPVGKPWSIGDTAFERCEVVRRDKQPRVFGLQRLEDLIARR